MINKKIFDDGRDATPIRLNRLLKNLNLIILMFSLACVGLIAVFIYWQIDRIVDIYIFTKEQILLSLSLGFIFVFLWISTFLWILFNHPHWLRKVFLLMSSLLILVGSLGVLSYIDDYSGPFAWATLYGRTNLGGSVGSFISGDQGLIGYLRISCIFIFAMSLAVPRVSFAVIKKTSLIKLGVFIVAKNVWYLIVKIPNYIDGYIKGNNARNQRGLNKIEANKLKELLKPEINDIDNSEGSNSDEFKVSVITDEEINNENDIRGSVFSNPNEKYTSLALNDKNNESLKTRFNKFWKNDAESQLIDQPYDQDDYKNKNDISTDNSNSRQERHLEVNLEALSWDRPSREILHDLPEGGITDSEIVDTGRKIKRTLQEYGVEVEVGETNPGPTVTMYGLIPGWIRKYKQVKELDDNGQPKLDAFGKIVNTRVETKTRVKVDSIMSREKDLSLALRTPSIRIETPAMGKALVGIEVPNPNPTRVSLRSVMESQNYITLRKKAKLPIALGKGSGGDAVVIDLASMPHLLVAGSTGSGKSVCINTIVSCLLMEKTPEEVRLLLVDPKRVELTPYNGIPHLLTPVVVETDEVVGLLKGMIAEMLNRYRVMEELGVRNIEAYNAKMQDPMPYLVIAVDELADLMMSASFDVEQSLCRLAQLGRATGIHLIVATQRPSVDVVTGLIKANFPSRISFGVTSQIDSRTILDTIGAEKLLGRGDMLYQALDASRPERVQGVFISDKEIEGLVKFWHNTSWANIPEVSLHSVGDPDKTDNPLDGDATNRDEMIDKAIDLAHSHNKLSTSLLQRRLRIGYPRAARLMDQLEEEGVVGPSDGSKSRDVIVGSI